MPRGAPRPGPQSANRSDLINPTPAPIQAVPGQEYGEAAAQQQGQQQVPTAPAPTGGQTATPAPTPGGGQPQPPEMAAFQQHLQNGGGVGPPLVRPTERPNEPIHAGLPMGPGPGPQSLQGVGAAARENAVDQGTLAHLFQNMAAQPNATQAIRALAAKAMSGAV